MLTNTKKFPNANKLDPTIITIQCTFGLADHPIQNRLIGTNQLPIKAGRSRFSGGIGPALPAFIAAILFLSAIRLSITMAIKPRIFPRAHILKTQMINALKDIGEGGEECVVDAKVESDVESE
jgi:hypothetical protein